MESLETPIGQMELVEPGIIVHRLRDGITVTVGDATKVKLATEALAAGNRVVMVVDLRPVAYADRDTRDAFSGSAGGVEIGSALVVDRGFSEQLASLFVRFSQPDRPVEVFFREADALEWARSILADR